MKHSLFPVWVCIPNRIGGNYIHDKSVGEKPLSIGGQKFEHGLGTHATSSIRITLNKNGERFTSDVGVDDDTEKRGSVAFKVVGDGKTLWESPVLHGGDAPKPVSVDLHGVKTLVLEVSDAGDGVGYDHADWANAAITMATGKPEAYVPPVEPAVILTPKPSPKPRINGARIFGVRPGHLSFSRLP